MYGIKEAGRALLILHNTVGCPRQSFTFPAYNRRVVKAGFRGANNQRKGTLNVAPFILSSDPCNLQGSIPCLFRMADKCVFLAQYSLI